MVRFNFTYLTLLSSYKYIYTRILLFNVLQLQLLKIILNQFLNFRISNYSNITIDSLNHLNITLVLSSKLVQLNKFEIFKGIIRFDSKDIH